MVKIDGRFLSSRSTAEIVAEYDRNFLKACELAKTSGRVYYNLLMVKADFIRAVKSAEIEVDDMPQDCEDLGMWSRQTQNCDTLLVGITEVQEETYALVILGLGAGRARCEKIEGTEDVEIGFEVGESYSYETALILIRAVRRV